MAVALEQFVKQLADSGVIAPGKLENFVPPKAHPKDAQELARQLVHSKCLTKFQAAEIYQGRAKALILGNYTILDKIGAGGMGQVYKAQHRRMDRIVAIKMLPKNVMRDAATLARFEREVRAAAKLEHPNIVTAYDADEAGGVHFLVMQYVEGSDLAALVKQHGPLPVAQAVNYILQAAKGLEFAHGEGVIHRDIKPANLLLDKKGVVKVLDMGLARIDSGGDAGTQAELTGTGAVMGTIDYMAPEQALSTHHADARADIYSLGCTFYYLLTGRAAYDGETLMAKLLAHREQQIPALGDDVPEDVAAVFRKMVAKNVEDRYQTMSQVVADLEKCTSGQQTSISIQQAVDTNLDNSALTFLKDIPARTKVKTKPSAAPASRHSAQGNKKSILAAVGGALAGLAILAFVIFRMQTKDGTLVVEVNEPDATVQVLDADGKVEISQPGGKEPINISVDPGKHLLKVAKEGFQFFAKDFTMESGGTATIKATLEPAKTALGPGQPNKPWNTPAFQQWMMAVAALPADKQVEAVAKKLQQLNSGFDGKVTGADGNGAPKIENGVVTQLRFDSDNVTDISPVRALVGLKALICPGSHPGTGKLFDLSPLQGMRLTILACNATQVSDLSPLRGMPLTELYCDNSSVTDLSPLEGMPLTILYCHHSKVSSLSPLQAMKLISLDCSATQVSDLMLLKGMSLTRLACWETDVSDLSPLKGMRLTYLDVGVSRVADLTPIKGMPLNFLSCNQTPVSDLSALQGMPLGALYCDETRVSDLSALEGMKLTTVAFTPKNIIKGIDIIRRMNSLKFIGPGVNLREPPAEFWKKYDAGQFGRSDSAVVLPDHKPITTRNDPAFQQWIKTVAAMPAEKQVEAVAQKLQELNPGFDGKESHKADGGIVTELTISADNLSDISPVRALSGLDRLHVQGSVYRADAKASFADLAPLEGMKLTQLECRSTHVADLAPLAGMPLSHLTIVMTDVSNLSPLKNLPLTHFYCQSSQVADLSPLAGMRLAMLYCDGSKVADLSPVKGMPLLNLSCYDTPLSDLTPLAGMKLRVLAFTPRNIRAGLDIVRRMPSIESVGVVWDDMVAPEKFWRRFDAGEFGKPTGTLNDPAFQQWIKGVAPLPAVQQVDAVAKKLQELNPRFDGIVTPKIDNGVVTELRFVTDDVRDISPVRALAGLKMLACAGSHGRKGNLSDLSPLQGMKLATLYCQRNTLADLSPLQGMGLTSLVCESTNVCDLSPLQGMNLTYAEITPKNIIKGIDVIRQMESLQLIGIGPKAKDKSPPAEFWKKYDAGEFGKANTTLDDPAFQAWIQTVVALPAAKQVEAVVKKLQEINPRYDGNETHKIKGGVVTELQFTSSEVTNISPVAALPRLKILRFYGGQGGSKLTDLSALKGMKLTVLALSGSRVADLSALQGMPLTILHCNATKVSDLSPLRGMPLTDLNCGSSHVTDLTPLQGLPLTTLACYNSKVSNLAPLRGMMLKSLNCSATQVSDLTPLEGCGTLRNLSLQGSNVTRADLSALQKALPNCKIEWPADGKFFSP